MRSPGQASWRASNGSAQRAGLLIDFLADHVEAVQVVAPPPGHGYRVGNVEYVFYQPTASEYERHSRVHRGFRRALRPLARAALDRGEDIWFSRHFEHLLYPSLARALQSLVDWADVVLVSFSFWSRPVARMARRRGIPLVVTTHDEISGQVPSSRLLRWLTLRVEIGALRKAQYRFASSEDDRRRFQRHGLTTEVVLPGVRLERGRTAPDVVSLDDLRRQLGLDGNRRYCLFVGTMHAPNVAAVAAIRDIAAALAARRRNDVGFIVVGDVIPPERNGNVIALGRVDEGVLDGLYQLAELIIIPLQAGTGTSRKTLEAMSFGKPILGTSVSVRGIPVVSGTHGIVSDDVAAYPDLIVAMLDDADRRQRLGAAARELAASFDSARVYNRYLDVFREIGRAQERGP